MLLECSLYVMGFGKKIILRNCFVPGISFKAELVVGFPYFFTLLALSEIHTVEVDAELDYAVEFIVSWYRRSRIEEPYKSRRQEILYRVQDRISQSSLNSD